MPAVAGQYEALCGGVRCTVTVSPDLIRSPLGSIPPSRVTYWGSTGDSKTSVGTGVATTILFGGIGLLGFLAKNHQYNFTINGFDDQGRKASMQLEFKNNVPAKQLMAELASVTGLGMGQTRTAQDILAAEQGKEVTLDSLGKMPKEAQLPATGAKAIQAKAAQANATPCWSTYLANNPAMQQWAIANPSQAEQNKKRYGKC